MRAVGTAKGRTAALAAIALGLAIAVPIAGGAEGRAGIGVYPAPGTDPLKRGIVVPENFPLPDGYVRHYQTTDDGTMLPAILMFHPDYAPVDDQGRPLALPADRIVPPELAPPGLPIEMLAVPATPEPPRETP